MAKSELQKQVDRLNKILKRASQRHYIIPTGVTARSFGSSAEQLKQVKPADVYARLGYVDPMSLRLMSGTERRAQERSQAAAKGAQARKYGKPARDTDTVLTNIQNLIAQWATKEEWTRPNKYGWVFSELKLKDKNKLQALLDIAIKREGSDVVATRLERNAEEANRLATEILYDSGDKETGVEPKFTRFAAILTGQIVDAETSRELTELAEAQGVNENP